MPGPSAGGVARRFASRLKFPQLFALTATLFVLDLLIPDLIPFLDEALLGCLAVLFGMWRDREGSAAKPPEKDVTPH
jgi:hypothetical protein